MKTNEYEVSVKAEGDSPAATKTLVSTGVSVKAEGASPAATKTGVSSGVTVKAEGASTAVAKTGLSAGVSVKAEGVSPAVTKPLVKIENIGQIFNTKSGKFTALRDINLDVFKGEVVSLIGHSGCGKSTLLNLIAGLTLPSSGVLLCAGREIPGPGPERAVVFQNHSLLPWMTCFGNVMLGVEQVFGRKEGKVKLRARVDAALEMVHMTHATHKYPHEISGGMKQRIGIARAFAMEPKILLMDEPFGALDALTRASLQDEMNGVMAKTGATVVMVTHDVDEAVLLSDRIVMMTNGPAATIGEILSVELERPRDRLVLAHDPKFAAYRAAVFEFLYRKQMKKAA